MQSDFGENELSSRKRVRDDTDIEEGLVPDKIPKVESALKEHLSEEDNKNLWDKPELAELKSEFFKSYLRNIYLDLIWKVSVPKAKFERELKFRDKYLNREGIEYNFSLSNIFYSGSSCASLIFCMQNGPGLSENDFDSDIKNIENMLILSEEAEEKQKESFAKPETVTKININLKTVSGTKDLNESQKMSEDIEIELSDHNADNGISAENDSNVDSLNLNTDSNRESGSNRSNSQDSIGLDSLGPTGSHIAPSVSSQISNNGGSNNNNYYSQSQTQTKETIYDKIFSESMLKILKGKYNHVLSNTISTENNTKLLNEEINDDDQTATYDINVSIAVVNFKTTSFTFKNLKQGEIILKEIPISTFFITKILNNEDPQIVIDLNIKKNYNQDSGFTGIVNQAMTCYMNSMLQTFNILGYFKKALYMVPVKESDLESNSVIYSMQRLYYDLMNEKYPVSTKSLTKSFGWSDDQVFIQHDVQEFNMILSDIMENRMKGTEAEGTFKYLFEGKTLNCIDCIDVDYSSKKEESFYDLQLTIKDCKNIYESLDKYTEVETLDGEDKYQTDEFGKQRAKKYLKFSSFPPVLTLQLKRFEYNPRKDQMDKINDLFQFDEEIDLASYKISNADEENVPMRNSDDVYSLHSVVVHKGNINNGHYFAYIKPHENSKWYLFNDENVREAEYDDVFTINYGGQPDVYKHKDRGLVSKLNTRSEGSAYILIYIKNSMRSSILCPMTVNDIPVNSRQLIEREKMDEKKKREDRIRKTRNMNIYLLSKQEILNHKSLGITTSNLEIEYDEKIADCHNSLINLPKDFKMLDLKQFVSKMTGIPSQFLIFFTFTLTDHGKIMTRHDFKMNHINDDLIEKKTIFEIFMIFYGSKCCLRQMYLYIDHILPLDFRPNVELFMNNINVCDGETECHLNDEAKTVLYFHNENKLLFKYNENLTSLNVNDYPVAENQTLKLIFMKVCDLKTKSLIILDIIPVTFDERLDTFVEDCLKPKYRQVISLNFNQDHLSKVDIEAYFLVELTSAIYEKPSAIVNENCKNPVVEEACIDGSGVNGGNCQDTLNKEEESDFLKQFDKVSELFNQNNDCDSVILVPCLTIKSKTGSETSLFKNIEIIFRNIFCTIYPEVYFSPETSESFQYRDLDKYAFYLTETTEQIENRLFNYVSLNNFETLKQISKESLDIYFFDKEKKLFSQNDYIDLLTTQNLIVEEVRVPQIYLDEVAKYPLLQYLGVSRNHINHNMKFKISYFDEGDEDIVYRSSSFVLFDVNNNSMVKINYTFPSDIVVCRDIIDYVYQDILIKFYGNISNTNFYFLVQNERGSFIYDLFADKNDCLFKFENQRLPMIFRLQPYSNEEIETFDQDDRAKLFCAFNTKDGKVACYPMIYYIRKNASVKEVKSVLIEKMNKINKLTKAYGEVTMQKVKFYTYSLIDYSPMKDILLLNTKDDEPILNYFKRNGAHNLLVEFLINDDSENTSSNYNGCINDSLQILHN